MKFIAIAAALIAGPALAGSDVDLAKANLICSHHHVPPGMTHFEVGYDGCLQVEQQWQALTGDRRNAAVVGAQPDDQDQIAKALQ